MSASPATANFLRSWRSFKRPVLLAYIQVRSKHGGRYLAATSVATTTSTSDPFRITSAALFSSSFEGCEITGSLLNAGHVSPGTYVTRYIDASNMMISHPVLTAAAAVSATFSGGRIVRASSMQLSDPILGGFNWQNALVAATAIQSAGEFLTPGPNFDTVSITLANTKLYFQTGLGDTAEAAVADFMWDGAKVYLNLWDDGTLVDFNDSLRVYNGTVNSFEITDTGITLNCIQKRELNRRIPTHFVDPTLYPNALEAVHGQPIGPIYGDWRAPGMRNPWLDNYTHKNNHILSGGIGHLLRGTLVDPGTGTAKAKVLFAKHQMLLAQASGNGCRFYIDSGGVICPLDGAGLTITNSSSEFSIEIADDTLVAFYPVVPTDVRTSGGLTNNNATSPRHALNVVDETTFATLGNATGGVKSLVLQLPSLSNNGQILGYQLCIGHSGNLNANMRAFVLDQVNGLTSDIFSIAQSATPTTSLLTFTAWPGGFTTAAEWAFGGTANPRDLVIDSTGSTTGSAQIYWVALVIKFRPPMSVAVEAREGRRNVGKKIGPGGRKEKKGAGRVETVLFPETLQLEGDFYCNAMGIFDDGSGTYTGTAGNLLERPCDIVHHLLRNYGAATSSDVNVASGSFGSFADARLNFTREGGHYVAAGVVSQPTDINAVISQIAAENIALIYHDRFTERFLYIPWRSQAQVDVDRKVKVEDIVDLSVGYTSDTSIQNSIRIQYGRDDAGLSLYEASLSDIGSGMGFVPNAQRDQDFTIVTGVNDKIDLTTMTPANVTVTLNDGFYHAAAMAAEIRRAIRAQAGTTNFACGYGRYILKGYNDKLDFMVGASTYVATLNEGRYSDFGLGSEMQRAMKAAVDNGWLVKWDSSNGEYRITGTSSFTILNATGANKAQSAWPSTGANLVTNIGSGASLGTGLQYIADRIWMKWQTTTAGFRWNSGANKATSAARTLGYLDSADTTGISDYIADNLRGDRQMRARRALRVYGGRRPAVIGSDWIRVFNVAGDLRDRLFDFREMPRIEVRFSTQSFPDLQRGRVLEFDAGVDNLRTFPGGDKSWANKRFVVVETAQHLGPTSWLTEVVCIDVSLTGGW